MIELKLPYPPSANRYWRTRVVDMPGKPAFVQTYPSSEAKEFKKAAGWLARAAGIRQPLQGRIAIAYTLHPHLPLDWATRARKDPQGWELSVQCLDLDNAQKVLLDSLKGIVFEDDRMVWRSVAQRGEPVPDGCVVVRIEQFVGETPQALLDLTPLETTR